MKIFATDNFLQIWDCLAYIIKNYKIASLTSGSEHLLKVITYVTLQNK